MKCSTRWAVITGIWSVNGLQWHFLGYPQWLVGLALVTASLSGSLAYWELKSEQEKKK